MTAPVFRSTLDRSDSLLLVVDLQAKLMPAIDGGEAIVRRTVVLAEAAVRLGVPILVTEQNPAGLGPSVDALRPYAADVVEKRHFSAARGQGFFERLPPGRRTVLVAGAEAHVCVLQTALGLLDAGFRVALAVDAAGSRRASDKEVALRRMESCGVELVTSEMALFEWLESCDDPAFKSVMGLIKPL